MATAEELSGPYEHFLIAPPGAGPGVCAVCHGRCNPGFSRCYQCDRATKILGGLFPEVVCPISLAPEHGDARGPWDQRFSGQLYAVLRDYKEAYLTPAQIRRFKLELAAVLYRFLSGNWGTFTDLLGGPPGLGTHVPSTRRQTMHPLTEVVGWVFRPHGLRVLRFSGPMKEKRTPDPDRFIIRPELLGDVRGRRAVVVDDLWTSGANVLSAAAALKKAGAVAVAAVTFGRYMRQNDSGDVEFLEQACDRMGGTGFRWDSCCVAPGAQDDHGELTLF